ncbi:MAG: diguanylate cyclase [Okeania sp. SIO2C9]|uniref:AAA-like domain-containing protein n=1 Tax=Okeania sp. SIO2C9 TaxID=2607791 RepID=UPI0013C04009|nr:AAA-like domain-containing protein [Okeania sp. SIO2C9]NEQ77966.1 diguanylate cyclase [Okeania sp. SIO2C9]
MTHLTQSLIFPSSPVPLNSKFYIERPPIEEQAYNAICKPGNVLRIRAPKKMGKSSLVSRIIAYAQGIEYKTVNIDFQQADQSVFANLNKFLRWFCANVSLQLKVENILDDFWDEDIGSKVSCTVYFEEYLLAQFDTPIVLVLNEVNILFEHLDIAQDFLPMLRYWHEQAQQIEIFEQLRCVVVYSTEIYIKLNINQSPFNVGLQIQLPEFNEEQILQLAHKYGLNWKGKNEPKQLMAMVGGHPYLVHLAIYFLSQQDISLERLLLEAPTHAGIYSDHLRSLWEILLQNSELSSAFKNILIDKNNVELEALIAYKLDSLGLVKFNFNECRYSRELYRIYFQKGIERTELDYQYRLEELEKDNQKLKNLVNIDSLTQIYNRRYFDQYLNAEWQRMAREESPLSLILLDVDCFKLYNDTYGHQAGDNCLQKVALTVRNCLKYPTHIIARYGGEEFAVILPQTDNKDAYSVAEKISNKIKFLAIKHINSKVKLGIVTVSIGVSCTVPNYKENPSILVRAADEAIYQSKAQGRDRITISPFLNFNSSK